MREIDHDLERFPRLCQLIKFAVCDELRSALDSAFEHFVSSMIKTPEIKVSVMLEEGTFVLTPAREDLTKATAEGWQA